MSIQEFISGNKTLIIAPAGYGKTYTLAACIEQTPDFKKQLILTHTHAGIASIKGKIKKFNIPSSKYHIETITGFAQKYALSYYCENDIPSQDSKDYYDFIIAKAIEIFAISAVKRTFINSYDGIFVDEYQDCTKSQHKLIRILSESLPIHIFGDPMQGIFGFNDTLVNFDYDLNDFQRISELDTPWRWKDEGNNTKLGETLKNVRQIFLSNNKTLNLNSLDSVEYIQISENDFYNFRSTYRQKLYEYINNKNVNEYNSLLILVPEYFENNKPRGGITSRSMLKAQIDYANEITLLEAIDNKDFYNISKAIDNIILTIHRKKKKLKTLHDDIFQKLFNKTDIKEWIIEDRIVNKKGEKAYFKSQLDLRISSFMESPSITSLKDIIIFMKEQLKFKCKRHDLLFSIIKAMNISIYENKTVFEAMVSHKNIVRRVGRKIHGKCLGTTLLTKGLEFDTVVILNAHRFDNYKHFYVAITRACKKLVIFSERETLNFN